MSTPAIGPAGTIAELLARQASRAPTRPAITWPDRGSLSYQELATRVRETALAVQRLGFGRNDRLALALPNGADLAVTLLSVMSVAAAVPLDPDAPAEQLARYLRGSRARALAIEDTGHGAAAEAAAAASLPVIVVGGGEPPRTGAGRATRHGVPGADGSVRPADHAVILHTSGTTGIEKFVALRQYSLCLSAVNVASNLELAAADRCLNVMPLWHAHGLLTPLLATLSSGGTLLCLPRFDVDSFHAALAWFRPSWYSAVPTIHQELLARAGQHRDTITRGALRFVRSASSPLPPQVLDQLEGTFGVPVIESYGMTETTSVVASNPLPPGVRKPGSVGLPVGCEIAILDAQGHRVPVGQVGEVAVRGPTVADGYDGADNERDADGYAPDGSTARAFVDGWFRTGDLGRLDGAGYLYLAGRTKEIINRGGRTVSPFEIEQVLHSHPAVARAVAFPVPHRSLGEDVAAAVVPVAGARPSEQELRTFAASQLDRTLLPSRIILVDRIPQGATGKVQRLRLHEQLPMPPAPPTGPHTELQATLVAIWKEVLERDRIGIHDNFFDLGGDSLSAVRVCESVVARTGSAVSVVDLFASPTIAMLTELLGARGTGEPAGVDAGAIRAGRERLAGRRGSGGGRD